MPETAKVNGREDAPSTAEEPGIGANKVVLHPVENSSGEIEAAPPSPEGPQQLEAPKEPQPEPSNEKSAHDVADNIADHPAEAAETEGEEGASEKKATAPIPNMGRVTSPVGMASTIYTNSPPRRRLSMRRSRVTVSPSKVSRAIALLQRSPWLPAHFKHWKAQAIQAPVFPASTTSSPMPCRRRF